jgi:sugar (pentulose or hexulose) kinase
MNVPAGSQFGAQGAAINVGVAAGFYASAQEAVKHAVKMERFYQPNLSNTRLYQELYEVYQKTAERQMDLWDLRASILKGERGT